jgi:drug/metabolite transporter (DMT)-like permease
LAGFRLVGAFLMKSNAALTSERRSWIRTTTLTCVAMLAFASNSVLCRLALAQTGIDPASFTLVRLVAGTAMLAAISVAAGRGFPKAGSWAAALALFAYAAAFSFAYVSLAAGAGALLLFGAVQATMVVVGLLRGEHLGGIQWFGLAVALVGLAALVAPGISAPPPLGAALMIGAGVSWGAYSILGRGATDPLAATAGNFLRAAPMTLVLIAPMTWGAQPLSGLAYAILSGVLASGVGYSIWYAALPGLSAAQGASVQLSVPVITAVGGALFLGEPVTTRLTLSSEVVLGGSAIVILRRARRSF